VIFLVALLLISATAALVYYGQYQSEASRNQQYVGELNTALTSYSSLSGSFNSSLLDYNQTLSLLALAVGNLNTSTPAYQNASLALSSLWTSYQELAAANGRKALVYDVNLLMDFGNGSIRWYNDSAAQPGWNGYVTTLVLLKGNVQAVWYPQYGEHLVTGIDGVTEASATSWFVWEFEGGGWAPAQSGADQIQINNGTTIAWTLCPYDSNFDPTCTP
jgi:hypothetical protein